MVVVGVGHRRRVRIRRAEMEVDISGIQVDKRKADATLPAMDERGRPSVFIGSSSEKADMAVAVKEVLAERGTLEVWHWKDAFGDAETVIGGLLQALW